jgi:hypothetical protein
VEVMPPDNALAAPVRFAMIDLATVTVPELQKLTGEFEFKLGKTATLHGVHIGLRYTAEFIAVCLCEWQQEPTLISPQRSHTTTAGFVSYFDVEFDSFNTAGTAVYARDVPVRSVAGCYGISRGLHVHLMIDF